MSRLALLALSSAFSIAWAASLPAVSSEISPASGRGAAPEHLQPRFFEHLGAKRVKLRYGPFTAPSAVDDMGMVELAEENITIPCTDCYITSWTPGLEFPDGSYANVNTSMWLHHLVITNPQQKDPSCPGRADAIERVLQGGNERATIDLTLKGVRKTGYYIAPNNTIDLVAEVMNQTPSPRQVMLTMEWEYLRAPVEDFQAAKPVWLDVDGACGSFINQSDVAVPNNSVFTLAMEPEWTATFAGDVVSVFMHAHDGAVSLEAAKNGRVVCRASPRYGESSGFIEPMGGAEMPGMDMSVAHISSIPCPWDPLEKTDVGDVWTVKVNYNFTAHPAMMGEDNKPAPVMGICVVYIAI